MTPAPASVDEAFRARKRVWRNAVREGILGQRTLKAAQGMCRKKVRQLAQVQRRMRAREKKLRAALDHLKECRHKEFLTSGAKKHVARLWESVLEDKRAVSGAQKAVRAAKAERRAAVRTAQAAIGRRQGAHTQVRVQSLKMRQAQAERKAEDSRLARLQALSEKHDAMRQELAAQHREEMKQLETRLQGEARNFKQKEVDKRREEGTKRKHRAALYCKQLREGNPLHADKFRKLGASASSCEEENPNFSGRISVLMPRAQKHKYTLVYLHQFCCDGVSYADWKPNYFCSSTKLPCLNLKVTLPTAKAIPIAHQGGCVQYAWYDYKTDFEGACEDKIQLQSLRDSRDRIFRILDREIELLGGDASKVFIGGASQGCCAALHCALQYPRRLGGFVGTVGHLTSATPTPASKKDMPIYLLNGDEDTVMQWSWVRKTINRFKQAGYTNVHVNLVKGLTHWKLNGMERRWILHFLSKQIGKKNDCKADLCD